MFTCVGLIIQSKPLPESDYQEGLRLTVPTPPAPPDLVPCQKGFMSKWLHHTRHAFQDTGGETPGVISCSFNCYTITETTSCRHLTYI